MSMKQKDAVFNAIVALRGTPTFTGAVELTSEERKSVSKTLFDGIKDSSITYEGDTSSDAKLTQYVSGLISNWLRKDSRLNGNTVYVPKNPGTRTGQGDDQMRAMRTLLNQTEDAEAREQIQAAIDERAKELRPKKTINLDALPEKLRHLAQ
jgi:hypothetical protein